MILKSDPQLWKIGQEGVPPVISGFSTGSQGIPASTKISNPEQIAAFMIFNGPPLEFKCCRTSCGLEMSWVFEVKMCFRLNHRKWRQIICPSPYKGDYLLQGILGERMSQRNCKFPFRHDVSQVAISQGSKEPMSSVLPLTSDLEGSKDIPTGRITVNHLKW